MASLRKYNLIRDVQRPVLSRYFDQGMTGKVLANNTLIEKASEEAKVSKQTVKPTATDVPFANSPWHLTIITQLLLRLIEVQDIVTEFAHLRNRALIGFNDLPQSVISAVSHHFKKLPGMSLTVQALDEGFPLLIDPITEYSHSPRQMVLTTLVTVPRIVSEDSLCTVETLVPLKYQIKDKCFTGPLARQDLVLISCKRKQFVLKADVLSACFSQPNAHICPHSVLRDANDTSWIGLPWVADTKLNYDRNHIYTTCDDSDTLHHIGGRYYLSTTTQNIELSKGTLQMTPLSIYHIPCNETNPKLKTGFGNCPETLKVSIPIFQEQSVNYIPWIPPKMDSAYELHYKSLNISPPLKFNKSIINALDKTFIRLDGQLQKKMKLIYKEIDAIKETQETEKAFIVGCIALSLAGLNSLFLIAFCCCFNKVSKFIAGPTDAVSHVAAKFTKSPPKPPKQPVPPQQPDAHADHPNSVGYNQPLNGQISVHPSDDESSHDEQ
ncbi:hypothetical protein AC249_AIPGENE1066 [Exaiptasia diaphana]|nr:hypothetical protein AC249_AIPGENE1066 [Exaiptasia diaphana]